MADKIIGRFYFKKTCNGNLIGEFSNDHGPDVSTESCDLIGSSNGYIGKYHSTWQEKEESLFANLTIEKKGSSHLFALNWSRDDHSVFVGEGMMCDEILIGNYQSA